MYELVITVGNKYNVKHVLKRGTYAEISGTTCQFNDTNELRESEEFKNLVDAFVSKHPTETTRIVVIRPKSYDKNIESSKEEEYIPHRVIYYSDKKLFEKLLVLPKSKDKEYHEWLDFWYSLKVGVGSGKVIPTLDNVNEVESINKKISDNDEVFNSCKQRFNHLLYKFPMWFRVAFYPYDTRFKRQLFPEFKRIIRNDLNLYYDLCEIVLKAFDKYVNTYKLQGNDANDMFGKYLSIKNTKKNKVKKKLVLQKDNSLAKPVIINEDEVIDEFARYDTEIPDYMHTPDYLRLKSFIDAKDVEEIKKYFELHFPVNMTQDELDEIQEIIKSSKKVK